MSWQLAVTIIGIVAALVVPLLTLRRSGQTDRNARLDKLEQKFHVLEDYTYTLRRKLEDAGQPVPPWPTELGGHS